MFGPSLALNTHSDIPDMNTFVKRSAGKISSIWAEGYTINRFLMFCERMDTCSPFHLP